MTLSRRSRANLLLLLGSAIWGFAFVAQVVGAHVGAFTFVSARSVLGFVALLPVIAWADRRRGAGPARGAGGARVAGPRRPEQGASGGGPTAGRPAAGASGRAWRATIVPGLACGLALFGGSALQQFGIEQSTAGNAAFVTGLYVVLVPLVGALFLGHRLTSTIWAGALLAVGGLYLLTMAGGPGRMNPGDLLVLGGTAFWTAHILTVGHFSRRVDSLRLAAAQFLACALYAGVAALIFEPRPFADLGSAWLPLLYAGVLSSGVGFTLQVVAQADALESHAALIMSLETVFGALGGALLLGERMSPLGYTGAAIMFAGICVAQLPPPGRRGRRLVPAPEPTVTGLADLEDALDRTLDRPGAQR